MKKKDKHSIVQKIRGIDLSSCSLIVIWTTRPRDIIHTLERVKLPLIKPMPVICLRPEEGLEAVGDEDLKKVGLIRWKSVTSADQKN